MAMSDRQIQKEILRLKKEIDLLESQIQSGLKSKSDKEHENKRLDDDIRNQDEENKVLADSLTKHESSIGELDEEFKDNQLKSGKIRKEMNLIKEDLDRKRKEQKIKEDEIEKMLNQIEDAKKKIKEEKRSKENADYSLRKTNAKIAEIQSHWASKVVTSQIERDAKKAGKKTDEIKKGDEDIKAYQEAMDENRKAQMAPTGKTDSDDDMSEIEDVEIEKVAKKKGDDKGLDLNF